MNEQLFATYIIEALREHPDWTPTAIKAVSEGSKAALKTMSQRAHEAQDAAMMAISLIQPGRMSKRMKTVCQDRLAEYLGGIPGKAPIERDTLERLELERKEQADG